MNDFPPTTHNLPPFDPAIVVDTAILADQLRAAYGHLFIERDGYLEAAQNWKANHQRGISSDEDEKNSLDQIAQIASFLDAAHGKPNSIHTAAKKPFLEGGRIVDAVLNSELAGQLRTDLDQLKRAVLAYQQERAARVQRERAQEAAKLAEAAKQALMASARPNDEDSALEAEQAALASAASAQAKISDDTRTRTDLGVVASTAGVWKARVVDIDRVPRAFMQPDMTMIEAKMKSSRVKGGPPTAVIPGVEFYQEQSLRVRK